MGKFPVLSAAYAVTWLIHLVYLGILALGYKRIRDEFPPERPMNGKNQS